MKKTGRVLMTAELGAEYGFVDTDGKKATFLILFYYDIRQPLVCRVVLAIKTIENFYNPLLTEFHHT